MTQFSIAANGSHPRAGRPSWRQSLQAATKAAGAAVLILLLGIGVPAAQGAQDDEQPAAAAPGAEDASAAEQDPAPANANVEAPAEVFLPSEEISEDYAVAFPVDI